MTSPRRLTFDRQLLILLVAQAIAGSALPVYFLISGLIGPEIAPTPSLTTLPMSLVVVGVAATSPLASFAMSRLGRKRGHQLGAALTMLASMVAGWGLHLWSFGTYCGGCLLLGVGAAFNNQIRFTAAESAGDQKAQVHSWVLMFGLFPALIGPSIARFGRDLLPYGPYTGSTALLFVLLGLLSVLMLFLSPFATFKRAEPQTGPSVARAVLGSRPFWSAALAGTAAFSTMTLLMAATPMQMHQHEHYSIAETTLTIQSHIVAMFLPSLFSGAVLAWLGLRKLIALGIGLALLSIAIAYQSAAFHHYWWALVLLGVSWNFLFLAGSTCISVSFSGRQGFFAQGANDALVYGIQSVASLSAGWILFKWGWHRLVLAPLPFLAALAVFSFLPQGKKLRLPKTLTVARRASGPEV